MIETSLVYVIQKRKLETSIYAYQIGAGTFNNDVLLML